MKTKFLYALTIAAGFSGCAPKVMILQSPIVSMKENNSGSSRNWGEGRPIEEKWCADEEPIKANNDSSKHYGMIDQVIWKAHEKSHANFFKDAKFYQQGTCVSITAEAVNVSSAESYRPTSQPSAPAKAPAPDLKRKKKS